VTPLSWVIGSGGLLGSHVTQALPSWSHVWQPPRPIRWKLNGGLDDLVECAASFRAAVGDRPWSVLWCAGVGTQGATTAVLDAELTALAAVLDALGPTTSPGVFFFASSAGGVYAGSAMPPFDEETVTRPISPYGEAKLRAEQLVRDWSHHTGASVVIGRIANLYGPGQNLAKGQGVISQVCLQSLRHRPLVLYVPLDTLRDYVFAPDCAVLVRACVAEALRQHKEQGATVTVKILASQQPVAIGTLLHNARVIFKRSLGLILGRSPQSAVQVRTLTFRSIIWPHLDQMAFTPLPIGMARTAEAMLHDVQQGNYSIQ